MTPSRLPPPVARLSRREPQLLRFRLRQMFYMVTLASVLCALLVGTEGPWPWLISLAALLAAAHVLGNLLGTRLRDTSQEIVAWRALQPELDPDLPVATGLPIELAKLNLPPGTPLASHERIARGTAWFVAGGLALGLVAGSMAIALTIGPRIEWAGWVVGTISCGVLGAWAAFLASSFSSIARHAWRHANERSN